MATGKYKLKQDRGVLHIGGGRFFYPSEVYELSDAELQSYGHYFESEATEKVLPPKENKEDASNTTLTSDNEQTAETAEEALAEEEEKLAQETRKERKTNKK